LIRRAEEADLATLRAMMAGSNGYGRPEELAMIQTFARDWWFTADDQVWVMTDAAGIVGFYALVVDAIGWELDLFFIANDRQGRGLGRALFDDMTARARGLGAAEVRIRANPSAADFYSRMGALAAGFEPPSNKVSWPRPIFKAAI
jgi:GNAT superfamily N-acetyltransferase